MVELSKLVDEISILPKNAQILSKEMALKVGLGLSAIGLGYLAINYLKHEHFESTKEATILEKVKCKSFCFYIEIIIQKKNTKEKREESSTNHLD